jgi:diketogulonate reductase-like aldo/keto reductase
MDAETSLTLNTGTVMPKLGFGVWKIPDGEAEGAVTTALEAGYRCIDTAAVYGNEEGVGRAVAAAGLPREEVFVTTKLWNRAQGHDATLRAFDASLQRLRLDHVDLYLIHWPMPDHDAYPDTYRAMESLHADGRAKAIGVSNFLPGHLDRLVRETSLVPAVNQIELHPLMQQAELRSRNAAHGVVTVGWSPLANGKHGLLDTPALVAVARKHGRSPAQVALRWQLQLGNGVVTKSATPSRVRENFAIFDFALDTDDLRALAALNEDRRFGPDPARFHHDAP